MTPWTVARQAPLSMEFSRQEYWSGLPFPLPGDFPDLEIEPLAGRFFTTESPEKSMYQIRSDQISRSVVSDSLRPHESQHARPPCPSPTPGVHSDSRPSSQVMPSNHLILCRSLLLLPPIPPSITVFSNESTLPMRWPNY